MCVGGKRTTFAPCLMKEQITYILLCLAVLVADYATGSVTADLQDTLREVTVVNQRVAAVQQSNSSAMTTLYMRQLEQEQRATYKDLSALVPNLYVPDYGSRMTSTIYMRGLGARIDNPVLGIYVDGVGIANKNAYDFDLFDIRSMQLCRGPQGTLFGRNTIGGVMLVETISPLDWQGTRAYIGYGNHNSIEAKAGHYDIIGSKNSSQYGIAVAGAYRRTDGCFVNEYDGKCVDAGKEAGLRLRFDGRNSHGYKNSTFVSYNFVDQGGFPYHQPDKPVNHNDTCRYTRHSLTLGSNYSMPLQTVVLSGATSYQFLLDRMQMDQDYLPLPYFTLTQAQQEHYVSQELTLKPTDTMKGKKVVWDWITGVSLSYSHNSMSAPVHFFRTGIDSLILRSANNGLRTAFPDAEMLLLEDDFVIGSTFTTQSADVAAYHTSYLTWGRWQLEAGLRLDFEYRHFRYLSEGTLHYKVANTSVTDFREIHSVVSGTSALPCFEALPKLAVSYNAPQWHAFLSVGEGYKAGGFNTQLFSDILQNTMMTDMMNDMGVGFSEGSEYNASEVVTYKPERCLDVEAGVDGTYTHGDLRLQGAFTFYELEVFNQQLTVFPKRGTGRLMTNAGRSRSIGAELSAAILWKGLTFKADYGYTYAAFVRYDNGKQDFSGNRVPYVPEHTLSLSADYAFQFRHKVFHALVLNLNTQAFGPLFWNEENTERQQFYALLNANLTLKMKYVSIALWGKNLTQTKYDVFRFVSMGNTFLQSGRPLTFGGKIILEI